MLNSVGSNLISDIGVNYLAHVLLEPLPPPLQHLDLSGHRMRRSGFCKLAKMVRYNTSITALDISWGFDGFQQWAPRPAADLSHPSVDLSLPDRQNFELLWRHFGLDVTLRDVAATYVTSKKAKDAAKAAARNRKAAGRGRSTSKPAGATSSRSGRPGVGNKASVIKPPLTGRKRFAYKGGSSSGSSADSEHYWWTEFDDYISDFQEDLIGASLGKPKPPPGGGAGTAPKAPAAEPVASPGTAVVALPGGAGTGAGAPAGGDALTGGDEPSTAIVAIPGPGELSVATSPDNTEGSAAVVNLGGLKPKPPPPAPPVAITVSDQSLLSILTSAAAGQGNNMQYALSPTANADSDALSAPPGPIRVTYTRRHHLGLPGRFPIPPPHIPRATGKKRRGLFGGKTAPTAAAGRKPVPPGAGAAAGDASSRSRSRGPKKEKDPLEGLNAYERRKKLIEMRRRDTRVKRMKRKRTDAAKLGVTYVGRALSRMVRNHNVTTIMYVRGATRHRACNWAALACGSCCNTLELWFSLCQHAECAHSRAGCRSPGHRAVQTPAPDVP